MFELNCKKIIIALLDERIHASEDLLSKFKMGSLNPSESLEKFKRWKDRVYSILFSYINKFEGNKFINLPVNCIYLFPVNYFISDKAILQIKFHVEFIKSLIETIEENHIYLKKSYVQTISYRILVNISNSERISSKYLDKDELADAISINVLELELYLEQLQRKKLIEYLSIKKIKITTEGSKEVRSYLEKQRMEKQKTYPEKEMTVLKTIYELSKDNPRNEVRYLEVQKATGLDWTEFKEIVSELDENKKYLGQASDEHLKVSLAGKEFLQGESNFNQSNSNSFTFNAPVVGFQHQTQNSTQDIQININPELDSAIKSLIELVKHSSLNDFIKEDTIANIKGFEQLSQKEKTSDLTEYAQKKIDLLKTTLEVGELALKVAPLIEIISKAF